MASLRLAPHAAIASIDAPRARQAEHVLFHPTRSSVISVTSSSLQELDLATGALIGEIEFDLSAAAASASSSSSAAAAAGASDRAHTLDHLIAVGRDSVVGVFQSKWIVVWNLQDHVLQSISEVEKMQKGMTAIVGSLCRDQWLFYASEGSASIKVTGVDSKEIPKKISRKAANRNSYITVLAYATAKRALCCGASDGSIQFWSFSEDNVLGGKDEAALATMLFASPATQSPVVQLTFAAAGTNAMYLVAGYQSRSIEVWALLASSSGKARDPQRVALTQFSPQQAVDFAKKSGELSFALHPQLPLLVVHWHPFAHSSSSSAIAWGFRPSIGGGSGAGSAGGALSDWCELLSAAARSVAGKAMNDDSVNCTAAVTWFQNRLVCYRATDVRSLTALRVDALDTTERGPVPNEPPTLTSHFALALEQYWNYQDVPTHLVQVTSNPELSAGAAEFVLQLVSLQTGLSEKLDDLPAWRNYQGKSLAPLTLVSNQTQSVVYVKLKDRSKATAPSSADADDASFAYVVMEIKPRAGAPRPRGDAGGSEGGDASSSFRVSCGAQLDALDVCFAEYRPDDARQSRPWVLVVLATSGKSLCLQTKCDQVENARILLPREVVRVFSSPVPLPEQSPHRATVGSRLLFVSIDASGRQVLELSDDDLSLSAVPAASGAPLSWATSARDEVVRSVTWNTPPPSATEHSASSAPSSEATDCEVLAAVLTSTRVVILTQSLTQVCAYNLAQDLHEPQSILWMAQTLLVVTKDNQVRYVTPRRPQLTDASASQLVCCLPETSQSTVQHTTLLAVCGDRLAYATTDARTLEVKAFVRPVSICEPLVAGFAVPSAKLKAIVERDVLVFVMTGGAESPSPLTDALLHTLYHDFGWRDTALRLLNALTNPPSSGGSSGAVTSAASTSSSSSQYPKTAHLAVPLLASLYLDAHKFREFLQVFLAHDPGLEEYALAAEDGAASSAKLPSRTGRLARRFQAFGQMLDAIGQPELALKCFDLAGDDLAIVNMVRTAGLTTAATAMLASLQKDWSKLNPPLSASVRAEAKSGDSLAQLDSVVWRRHDLFSLLCCDVLGQNERRSRLLASVKPFDKLSSAAASKSANSSSQPSSVALDSCACPRASVLPWKRLVPEDARDWIGVSATPHFSSDEPKNPSYGFGASMSSGLGGSSSSASGFAVAGGSSSDFGTSGAHGAGESSAAASADKMTIGPFVDDEDAVVTYWRFEDGATLSTSDSASAAPVESLDTSKRENNLQLLGFGAKTSLVSSTAPVDKGEEGRVQEAYALRFPSTSAGTDDDATDTSSDAREYGARCNVRSGSTLDIGFVFDDDPYRRKLTFEAWVRNFELARKRTQQLEDQGDESFDAASTSTQFADPATRTLVSRMSSGGGDVWWSFALVDGFLVLEFAGHSIRSDERVVNAATWHHVAFSIDVLSSKHAAVKLFLQGRCVGAKDSVSGIDSVNVKLYAAAASARSVESSSSSTTTTSVLSVLHLGSRLRDYEMTEVRVWAASRTQDQLSDMKENYLGIAEAKKRMKIAIHQRNCQCEKCHARRTKAPVAKLALPMGAFPSTPPAASVRDRRRPVPK